MRHTTLEGKRIRLRKLRESDLEDFLHYRSDPAVALYQGWEGFTYEQAIRFIREMQDSEPDIPGTWMQFAIALSLSDRMIGDCGLHTLMDDPNQMEVGITLDPLFQHQGYANEALECLFHYIFVTRGKHRVTARTDVRNDASNRLMERMGMRKEGHFLRNAWYKGEYTDEYLFAMLREEWMQRKTDVE